MTYDIIGDIHGHADALEALLKKLGYEERWWTWRHPERTAVFVGDFVDRGPKQLKTLEIVRRMVESENALAIMGNHEFNAIAFFIEDKENPGEYLRPHGQKKNITQHKAFLDEVIGTPKHKDIIDWFLTLPLWIEKDGFRAIHACWHREYIEFARGVLAPGYRLTSELMQTAAKKPPRWQWEEKEKTLYGAMEMLLKGPEIPLRDAEGKPVIYTDGENHARTDARTRWWKTDATRVRAAVIIEDQNVVNELPDISLPTYALPRPPERSGVTFFGHYWLRGRPRPSSETATCLDYSIANGGKLAAYRFDGEPVIDPDKFCWLEEQE